jgi:hypothetical protein
VARSVGCAQAGHHSSRRVGDRPRPSWDASQPQSTTRTDDPRRADRRLDDAVPGLDPRSRGCHHPAHGRLQPTPRGHRLARPGPSRDGSSYLTDSPSACAPPSTREPGSLGAYQASNHRCRIHLGSSRYRGGGACGSGGIGPRVYPSSTRCLRPGWARSWALRWLRRLVSNTRPRPCLPPPSQDCPRWWWTVGGSSARDGAPKSYSLCRRRNCIIRPRQAQLRRS